MKEKPKRITRVSDLPEWFDLSKYQGAELLDAAGWFDQLFARTNLLNDLRSLDYIRSEFNKDATLDAGTQLILADIRESPIVDLSNSSFLSNPIDYSMLLKKKTDNEYHQYGVHCLTLGEFYLTDILIPDERRDFARKYYSNRFDNESDPLNPGRKFPDWFNDEVDFMLKMGPFRLNELTARINLDLPDKVLINEFEALIKSARKRIGGKSLKSAKREKLNFSKWIRFGVLPYIDLNIWEKETNTNISWPVYADAIFGRGALHNDRPMDGENVRETTKSLAEKLLNFENIEMLAAIASEKNTGKNRT